MKKPAQHHKISKKVKPLKSGLLSSPAIQGLVALIPILLIVGFLGMQARRGGDRELFLKLGVSPSPELLMELARKAESEGDLEAGRKYYSKAMSYNSTSVVLGADSELEEKLWPELRLQREWKEIEGLVLEGKSAEILLRGAKIKKELGELNEAKRLWEKAWELDPNSSEIISFGELF